MNQACHGIKPLLECICAKSCAVIARTDLTGFFSASRFLILYMGHWCRVPPLVFRGMKKKDKEGSRFLQTPDLSVLHNFISDSFLWTIWKFLEWVSAESPDRILNYKISCWPSIYFSFPRGFCCCLGILICLLCGFFLYPFSWQGTQTLHMQTSTSNLVTWSLKLDIL